LENIVELVVSDVKNIENQTDAYALILKEAEGNRTIPILIGWSEARALVLMMNKAIVHRPSTHDLFVALTSNTQTYLEQVHIYKYEEGVYYSYLIMKNVENRGFEIDARTSDAVTLALAFHAPIFIEEEILNKMSFTEKKTKNNIPEPQPPIQSIIDSAKEIPENMEYFIENQLREMTLEELETLKEGAVESEDFELAAKIQVEIDRRV
jgi:bifunctional DNase/RNase